MRPALALVLSVMALSSAAAAQTPRMKAVVHHRFGPPGVLRFEEIDRPVPADDELLVKVRAASVNPLDWHYLEGTPYLGRLLEFGLLGPKVARLGVDFAGTVEAVGNKVTRFKPGDEVFGGSFGAFAEYVTVSAERVAAKPAGLSFEQAASIPIAGVTALQALRDAAKVQRGQKVLINGASGGVGTFAVQIARSLGAEVTGVCSTRNVELVRSLGAQHVIDYTKEDFTQGEERYDVIIDNVANHALLAVRGVLVPHGTYVLVGGGGRDDNRWLGPLVRPLRALVLSRLVSQRMGMMLAHMNPEDLTILAGMVQAGTLRPVIDRSYAFGQIPEALRYLETGHARGKVVIDYDAPSAAPASAGPTDGDVPSAGLVAFTLIGILAGITVAPVVAALALNRRFRRRNPGKRGYRWGYYFSVMSIVGGLLLGVILEAGAGVVLALGAVYGVLAFAFARRRRWAWLALTIVSFNPVAWIINLVYLWRRWAEDSMPPTRLGTTAAR